MTHPVLSQPSASRRQLLHILSFTGGIVITVLLLNPREAPPAPVPVSERTTVNSAPAEAGHPAPAAAPQTQPPVIAEAVPAVTTTTEMNRLVDDQSHSVESKLAALTEAMRSTERGLAFEAARRAVFLLKGDDFSRLAAPLFTDTALSPAAMEVLVLNLHDRPAGQSLPLFAAIANTPGHPFHAEAADTLRFHLKDKADATGDRLTQNVNSWLRAGQTSGSP